MKLLLTLLLATLCAVSGFGQTIKSLGFNTTNGQVIANTGTNVLTFIDNVQFHSVWAQNNFAVRSGTNDPIVYIGDDLIETSVPIEFSTNAASLTRANLGLGATWLTNTDVTNFRTAIGLGENSGVVFDSLTATSFQATAGTNYVQFNAGAIEFGGIGASRTRTNLGLGPTNNVAFRNITSGGNIVISNQSAATNGLLFVYRTNNEPFLGLANLLASNNTTISNETLFRVGVAEATNRSAQFGFRSTNTNGNGVAVFSVFGFDALMMIGADASTNAVIYSGGGTNNEVMTLIRDGATEFARPIRFSTNASTRPATNAPANTTNVAAWVEFRIGTNSYRAPLYQ
jgi:hypothetical protein